MATLYLGVPTVTLALWLVHAWWSWRRPDQRNPLKVLLHAGLPAAALVVLFVFGSIQERPRSPYDPLPPGDHGDVRLRLLIVAIELAVSWLVVLALEVLLEPVRSIQRRRTGNGSSAPTRGRH